MHLYYYHPCATAPARLLHHDGHGNALPSLHALRASKHAGDEAAGASEHGLAGLATDHDLLARCGAWVGEWRPWVWRVWSSKGHLFLLIH